MLDLCCLLLPKHSVTADRRQRRKDLLRSTVKPSDPMSMPPRNAASQREGHEEKRRGHEETRRGHEETRRGREEERTDASEERAASGTGVVLPGATRA